MRKTGIVTAIFLAMLAGLFAGVRWHERIGESVGWKPPPAAAVQPATEGEEEYWTCSMHPEVRQPGPGLCPICHMRLEKKLIPKAVFTIDPTVVQNMGVRFAPVTAGPLQTEIRAFGTLVEAQPLQHDVSLKIGGWIERLYADKEGMRLSKGDPLFDVYSPDLVVAQDEFLSAARALSERTAGGDAARAEAERNIENARSKLLFWDVPASEIDAIRKEGKPRRAVTFRSAWDADLVEKKIVQGSPVQAGERLLRIVDHSTLWVEAQIYEPQIPLVRIGQEVVSEVRGFEGKTFKGSVVLVHPHVDPMTRTMVARIEIPNPERSLKPGMYASVRFDVLVAPSAVLVPREAVLDTGTRKFAFVKDVGPGVFIPKDVRVGASGNDGMIQILDGLSPGEEVVVSGQLLLDSESRTQEALRKMKPAGNETAPTPSKAAMPAGMPSGHRHGP